MLDLYANPLIQGMTTNPTLMKKAGISDYEAFAKDILQTVKSKPISFEVFADDFAEMRRQALMMRDWQENVYVKIPVLSPAGESSVDLIRDLSSQGVKLNVTAILSEKQIADVASALNPASLPWCPSSPDASPIRVATRCRSCVPAMRSCARSRRPKSSGEAFARSSISFQADEPEFIS